MRIGVIDLLRAERSGSWYQAAYAALIIKQYASIMPQAVSVWCRQMGHQVFYATYYGQRDPKALLPDDLDVVFISTYTHASALAYALAKRFRRDGALTVIGGPHAKAFPQDAARFFDVVVRDCDRTLVAEILSGPPRGEIVTSGRALRDLPSVEERLPEIRASAFWRDRPYISTCFPMLASVGCPYSCNFCIDWNSPYALLPLDRLETDLRFISERFPGVLVAFHDPNFAVKFDEVFDVLERVAERSSSRYILETSLSILRGPRLKRLGVAGCVYIAPGVESWAAYSNKSGAGAAASGRRKLDQVVEHFGQIREYVPGIQANFIFGLDVDEGDEPVELTKEFMTRAPFVWPTLNIPTPFGGTPLHDQYLSEGRILTEMPFAFYYAPYLVTTVKHYSPVAYYEKLIEMSSHSSSVGMLAKRLRASPGVIRYAHALRGLSERHTAGAYRRIRDDLKADPQLRAFHEGSSKELPERYHHQYERMLGPYASLLSREDRRPLLVPGRHVLPLAKRHAAEDSAAERGAPAAAGTPSR